MGQQKVQGKHEKTTCHQTMLLLHQPLLFLTVLVDEALGHLLGACARGTMGCLFSGCSSIVPFASSIMIFTRTAVRYMQIIGCMGTEYTYDEMKQKF